MGTKDKTTRRLEAYNDVFADIINVLVFNGERRILEHDLLEVDTKSTFVADDRGIRSQDRDIAKFWSVQKIRLALFGLENQSTPDPTMPLRIYSYNGASYKAQLLPPMPKTAEKTTPDVHADPEGCAEPPTSEQQHYPVLTLVLYFGLKPWHTARTLYESVPVPDEMKPFIPDLPINLVEVAWLPDEVIDKFQSDFKVVAKFLKQLRLREDTHLDMQDPALSQPITHFLELMQLMSAYSHDPRFESEAHPLPPMEERNMLAVLTRLEDQGREEGKKEGKKEGRKEGRKEASEHLNMLYANLFKVGRANDVQRAVQDPEYLRQLMAEFGYPTDDEGQLT